MNRANLQNPNTTTTSTALGTITAQNGLLREVGVRPGSNPGLTPV